MDREHYLASQQEVQVSKIISALKDWINKYAKKNQIFDPLIFLDAFHEFELVIECLTPKSYNNLRSFMIGSILSDGIGPIPIQVTVSGSN